MKGAGPIVSFGTGPVFDATQLSTVPQSSESIRPRTYIERREPDYGSTKVRSGPSLASGVLTRLVDTFPYYRTNVHRCPESKNCTDD
jgi:hypothetical protein